MSLAMGTLKEKHVSSTDFYDKNLVVIDICD
jgi:hypothetical protein